MRLAKTILTGATLAVINSMALAQQAQTGTVTVIDRLDGNIWIQQPQSGTVGTNSAGVTEQFKIKTGMLDTVHAGDKVTFTVNETGGAKNITKIDVQ